MNLNKLNNIPIVFIHKGNQEYLKYAIKSAEKFNKNVFLLGDNSNKNLCRNFYNINNLKSEDFIEFKKVYKHMSTNSFEFELICFERYFILKEFMVKNNFNKVIMLDSDVLTFENYSNLGIEEYDIVLSEPEYQDNYRWTSCPHFSYWTISTINRFLKFCILTYKNNLKILETKYEWHEANKKAGGICDMTLLYLFPKNDIKFLNASKEYRNGVFDYNINYSENYFKSEYKYNNLLRIKKIMCIKNKIYLKKSDNGKEIRVYCIHFQGGAKCMMKYIYKYNMKYKIERVKFIISWLMKNKFKL
ncbi:hypothetical protein P5F61_08150 [Clostridium perfringens]|nr:hypothetical protein [Clostridium perfringens]HAT4257867.1 hypothetical protein [Clostridium perfringens]